VGGSTPKSTEPAYWNGDIPWITPDDLSRHKDKGIFVGRRAITRAGFDSCSVQMVPAGTVLYTSRAPIGYAAIARQPICTNQGFKSLIPPPGITSDYLFWYMRYATDLVKSRASGTTFAEISGKGMRSVPLLLAPTAEQERIVAAIEEQFSRLDAATAAAEHARTKLKRLKASALHLAVTGRLFETGPTSHELPVWDGGEQFDLPNGWSWRSLAEICSSVTDGDHQPPPKTDSGVPFLVIGNVKGGSLDFTGCRHVSPDYYNALHPTRQPRLGDVLYTLVGSYGIAVPVADDRPFCVQRHIGILRPSDVMTPAYLAAAMSSQVAFAQARDCATGTAQMTVPLGGLRRMVIPVPPVEVQGEILAALDRIDTSARSVDQALGTVLKRGMALRASVLTAAFGGTLTPQDRDDEPASFLLDRIKAAQAATAKPATRGRRRKVSA
jgi:type I restriction enzyme S subunit